MRRQLKVPRSSKRQLRYLQIALIAMATQTALALTKIGQPLTKITLPRPEIVDAKDILIKIAAVGRKLHSLSSHKISTDLILMDSRSYSSRLQASRRRLRMSPYRREGVHSCTSLTLVFCHAPNISLTICSSTLVPASQR